LQHFSRSKAMKAKSGVGDTQLLGVAAGKRADRRHVIGQRQRRLSDRDFFKQSRITVEAPPTSAPSLT